MKLSLYRYKINKYIRLICIFLSIIAFLCMVFLIYYTIKYKKYIEKKYNVTSYSNDATIDYNVLLLPNMIYTQNILEPGDIYITNYIDYIKTNLKYSFNSERPFNLRGRYKVTAHIEGYIQDNENEKGIKPIWQKEFTLLPETTFECESKELNFNREVPIKYNYFNDYVSEIIKSTGIYCNVKMTVTWNIDIEGNLNDEMIKESLSPTIDMPLNVKYFEIKGKLKEHKTGSITKTYKEISPLYIEKLIYYSLILLVSITSFIILIIFTTPLDSLDLTEKYIKKIIKQNGYRIAQLKEDAEFNDKDAIEVASFDDIVKLSDDLCKTILYRDDFKNKKCYTFYVKDGLTIYKYKFDNIYSRTSFNANITKTY
ncbi:hypothetical protein FDN13_06995 [Caloramator sp. E03]|uniref:DUF5305 family protein n=1 Tax=Caloramator sp. E03 TaxID=2576307 RepID=UPI0011101F2A|nr:DUF5305 family protein [Caloramator sp. E03]QCX33480.1 hypothetical protein FDN13_06995 [Caloramator sp. E03]